MQRVGGSVLFVGGDEATRRLVVRVLEDSDYHVQAVASGQKAIALLSQSDATFDLVITGAAVSVTEGESLPAWLRARRPRLRLLLVCGDDEVAPPSILPDGVLHEPITAHALVWHVGEALGIGM